MYRITRDLYTYVNSFKLAKRLSAYATDYDLIYERLWWFSEYTSKIAKKHKVPYFVEVNAPYEEMIDLNFQSPLYRFALKMMLRQLNRATAIIVVSSGIKKYLIDFGIDREKIFILPNGVDESKFDIAKIDSTTMRNDLKIGKNDIVIGYSGRLSLWGGLDKFIQIARKLMDFGYHNKVKLFLVGGSEDEDWEKFLDEINKLEHRDILLVTGFIDYSTFRI